jgi:hypothetical protein
MKHSFTQRQDRFIRTGYKKMSEAELLIAFNRHFGLRLQRKKLACYIGNHKIHSGRNGYFPKGHTPWNMALKGKGICKPNSGTFRKGTVPPNKKPIGSERIDSKDGYILIKVRQRDPNTGFPTRYRFKQVVLWERKHGKVPKGHVILFKDGNKRNFSDKNLTCITRNELARLNQSGYPYYSPEMKPSVFALMKLKVKIIAIKKKKNGRQ